MIYIYRKGDNGGRPDPNYEQNYVMSNNDNDGKLADTIYIICWGVDEPTLYAIFSKCFFVVNIE